MLAIRCSAHTKQCVCAFFFSAPHMCCFSKSDETASMPLQDKRQETRDRLLPFIISARAGQAHAQELSIPHESRLVAIK